jgi:hypothetical protein
LPRRPRPATPRRRGRLVVDARDGARATGNDPQARRRGQGRALGRLPGRALPRRPTGRVRQFASPITLLLIAATLVSAALGEVTDAAIILATELAKARFYRERRPGQPGHRRDD